jgi:prolyl-tRNA synthetase
MRYSDLFGKTKRDAPTEISDETLRLAFRAGLIRPIENGNILYLPLAANVLAQMFLMLRGDLHELAAQELRGVPDVNPGALAAAEIQSYKQLPARLYWYSRGMTRLHIAAVDLNPVAAQATHATLVQVASDLLQYAGVPVQTALAAGSARTWYASTPALTLQVFRSKGGTYAATRAAAAPFKTPVASEAAQPVEQVETPHCDTIEALANFLNVPVNRTAKAVFYSTGDRVIFAVVRGDLQIDEDKVKQALGLVSLRWATDDEIARVGAMPGYASPIGTRGATIIVDDSVINSPNLVAGANKTGYHLLNTNVPRDYKPDVVTDIALARPGDQAPDGSGELEVIRGTALGTLTDPRPWNATFLDANGKASKPFGVTLDLDLGALLLAHLGAHHDDKGILWARTIAPFDVHIVALNADKPDVVQALLRLDEALDRAGLEALVDDRAESAGVKFNDADLIGLPLRITVGPKTLAQGAVEFKAREESAVHLVPIDTVAEELNRWATME